MADEQKPVRMTVVTIAVPTETWGAVQPTLPKGSMVYAETLEDGLSDDARGRLSKQLQGSIKSAKVAPKPAETPADAAARLTRQAADREAADAAERRAREGDDAA